jgi:tetratricopeptide (TPR) repeat protein
MSSGKKPALLLLLLAMLLAPAAAQQLATDSLLEKGDQFIEIGKPVLARAEYEKAIRAGAKLQNDFARSRNLGFAYLNGSPHDFAKASQWLANAARLRSEDDEVRLALAQALTWSGNPASALQHWRALCSKSPQNTDYAVGLADALWASGDRQGCFDHLQRLVEASPSNITLRLEYARLLGYAKDYSSSSVQFQSVLQIDPTNLDAQVGMAKLLSWQESYAASIDRYDAVLKRSPRYYPALVGKGYSLMWMGKDEEARKSFELAARQNPRDPEVNEPLKKLRAEADRQARVNALVAQPTEKPKSTPAEKSPVTTTAAVQAPSAVVEPAQPSEETETTAEAEPAPDPTPAPDPVADLMTAADTAAAKSDFVTAIADYRVVLQLDPKNQEASIRLARVLSWNKQYDASLTQYGQVLGEQKAQNLQTRLERARVLSWAQKYDASIREYEALMQDLEASPAQGVSSREIRVEIAKVASWARNYDRSLAELSKIIPEKPTAEDAPALLLKARVLAYQRRYSQSIDTYNAVLALSPRDKDARLGKAQTLYWSGDLNQSRPMLREIVLSDPSNADAKLSLASVEHGTGNSRKAISLLKTLPDDGEVHTLRTAIQDSMRPVLRERFGWENDIEAPPNSQPSTTTRGLRLSSSIEFSPNADVRMELSNTVTHDTTSNPTLARYGTTSFAQETMLRVTVQPRPWLRLTAGAGVGTTGFGSSCPQPLVGPCTGGVDAAGKQRPVFDVHPVITWNKLRIDLSSSRHIADYTPLAVHDNVVQLRQQADVSYQFEHVRVGGEYRYINYTIEPGDRTQGLPSQLGTNSHGGAIYVTPRLYHTDRLTVEAGMRYDAFGYDGGAEQIGEAAPTGYGTAGFFTPRVYERYAGTGHIAWELAHKVHIELDGTFGPQRIFGFAALQAPAAKWGTTGTTTLQVSKSFGRFHPYLAYDFFSTATAAGPTIQDGSYSSHSIFGGFSYRF